MNATRLFLILTTAMLTLSALAAPPAKNPAEAKDVTAAQVNGT